MLIGHNLHGARTMINLHTVQAFLAGGQEIADVTRRLKPNNVGAEESM
jgi:hypothetical protein